MLMFIFSSAFSPLWIFRWFKLVLAEIDLSQSCVCFYCLTSPVLSFLILTQVYPQLPCLYIFLIFLLFVPLSSFYSTRLLFPCCSMCSYSVTCLRFGFFWLWPLLFWAVLFIALQITFFFNDSCLPDLLVLWICQTLSFYKFVYKLFQPPKGTKNFLSHGCSPEFKLHNIPKAMDIVSSKQLMCDSSL